MARRVWGRPDHDPGVPMSAVLERFVNASDVASTGNALEEDGPNTTDIARRGTRRDRLRARSIVHRLRERDVRRWVVREE